MSEIRRIRDQLRAVIGGTPWHGPPIWPLIDGVEASAAGSHPIGGAHSIWELVLHMTYWRQVALEALAGRSIAGHQPNTPEDWRTPDEHTEDAWREAREAFRQSQEELLGALGGLPDARLEDAVAGREYPIYVLLHGVIQHDIYHAGQIVLLKKAIDSTSG